MPALGKHSQAGAMAMSLSSHLQSHCFLMDKEAMLHSSSFPKLCNRLNRLARRYGLDAAVPGMLTLGQVVRAVIHRNQPASALSVGAAASVSWAEESGE